MDIRKYGMDGAHHQARAVLAHLQMRIGDGLEQSWNEQYKT